MRELRISDADLQRLVAPAIRRRLKAAGFQTGTPSNENTAFFFPINLDLAGEVKITRSEDGTWLIEQQTDAMLAERTADCAGLCLAAVMQREQPIKGD